MLTYTYYYYFFFSPSNLPPGWIIGPLGVPVRKTLDVGNRNIQKAYTEKVTSPNKELIMNNNNIGSFNMNGFNQNSFNDKLNAIDHTPTGGVGGGNLLNNFSDPTEDLTNKNKKQEEHRRVLQMQIEMKKKQKEEELLKEKLEDERLMRVIFFFIFILFIIFIIISYIIFFILGK